MGFDCPPRQTTADYLTSISSPTERVVRPGWESRVPRTADEFAQRWKESPERQQLLREIEAYEAEFPVGGQQLDKFRASRAAEQAKNMRPTSSYTISVPMQIRLCLRRSYQRTMGDLSATFSMIFGNIMMAFIVSSVFYNLGPGTENFYSRGALLFFAILLNAFASALEIFTLYQQRPIVEKHSKYALYHPFAEGVASTVIEFPAKIIIAIIFNLIIYFMVIRLLYLLNNVADAQCSPIFVAKSTAISFSCCSAS
jgi:ATP-binding cassette, subfamily G (WHITE), member 2, PDR